MSNVAPARLANKIPTSGHTHIATRACGKIRSRTMAGLSTGLGIQIYRSGEFSICPRVATNISTSVDINVVLGFKVQILVRDDVDIIFAVDRYRCTRIHIDCAIGDFHPRVTTFGDHVDVTGSL